MASQPSPQLQAAGEINSTPDYASLLSSKITIQHSGQNLAITKLKPIEIIHGEPTIKFTMEEIKQFVVEEGDARELLDATRDGKKSIVAGKSVVQDHVVSTCGHDRVEEVSFGQQLNSQEQVCSVVAIRKLVEEVEQNRGASLQTDATVIPQTSSNLQQERNTGPISDTRIDERHGLQVEN
ncbi:hypothetical protein HAX54_026760 [Datura stramonium]|uniref:Uncharacterized protein n=1 Tax=Datura stramonium TaxID=4076 RepID=A0ABS8V4J2_DATST|nr:hypothetical protein [Datura stramonium]